MLLKSFIDQKELSILKKWTVDVEDYFVAKVINNEIQPLRYTSHDGYGIVLTDDNIVLNKSDSATSLLFKIKKTNNIPSCIDKIKSKCINVTKEYFSNAFRADNVFDDFILNIKTNGWIEEHIDVVDSKITNVYKDAFIIRFNCLVNKPKKGGNIVHNKNTIIMDEGDIYIVDSKYPHSVSQVLEGSYRSVVFSFICLESKVNA